MPLTFTIINLVSAFGFITVIMTSVIYTRAVKGSALRYKMATLCMTAIWITVPTSAIMVLYWATQQEMLLVIVNGVNVLLSWTEWRRVKDEDHWWNGRGKKWLKTLDTTLSRLRTSAAPATV